MVSQPLSDEVSNRLLDSASELIIQGGPAAATVSAIATGAGVSRMTVYRKFPDRHAIIAALFNREFGAIVAETSSLEAPDQRTRIVEAVALSVERINNHPLMQAVLRHEPTELTEWITGRLAPPSVWPGRSCGNSSSPVSPTPATAASGRATPTPCR